MGSLTDNLLKLTDFPFSYSLIALFAFIFYGQGFLSLPLERLGPLLILMGFVATTLSITDPIGWLQKLFLKGFRSESIDSLVPGQVREVNFTSLTIFGRTTTEFFLSAGIAASIVSTFLRDSVNEMKGEPFFRHPLRWMSTSDRWRLYLILLSLRDSTLRTAWIGREIDKITSMIYFIIVVSIFFSALLIMQSFESRFVVIPESQGDSLTRIVIIVISGSALVEVIYKLVSRLRHLSKYARRAFIYLVVREAYLMARLIIKIEDEAFEKRLQEIEQYLSNGDWALTKILVDPLIGDYDNLYFKKLMLELDAKKAELESDKKDYRKLGIY